MLSFSGSLRVFVAVEACDMRKGFEDLSALVGTVLKEEVKSGALFAFSNPAPHAAQDPLLGRKRLMGLEQALGERNLRVAKAREWKSGGKLPLRAEALSMPWMESICVGPRCVRGMSATEEEAKILLGPNHVFCFATEAMKGLRKATSSRESRAARRERSIAGGSRIATSEDGLAHPACLWSLE